MLIILMFWLLIEMSAPWYMYSIAVAGGAEIIITWAIINQYAKERSGTDE